MQRRHCAPECEARARTIRLELFPRQAFLAPAGKRPAMVVLVERAFESFEDVEDLGEAGLFERHSSVERAVSAAANEHDGAVGAGDLLHLSHEMRIDVPVGPVVPCNVMRTDGMADEVILHLAAAV